MKKGAKQFISIFIFCSAFIIFMAAGSSDHESDSLYYTIQGILLLVMVVAGFYFAQTESENDLWN